MGLTLKKLFEIKKELERHKPHFPTKREAEIIIAEVDLAPGTVIFYE